MNSPVLFIVFNRPGLTQLVFDAIRIAKPKKLYVAADGPRANRPDELFQCERVRGIVSNIDWPCDVRFLFRDENLGCKLAVSGAISWFFSFEGEGIILEDDCLPNPDFFKFCDILLEKYRFEEAVGMISGCNFQNEVKRGNGDYYFSRFCHIWGWATWNRAWKKYDVEIKDWPTLKQSKWLESLGFSGAEKKYWEDAFDRTFSNNLDTWDHQWSLACWANEMLAINPNKNLITNIGFGADATHTVGKSIFSKMKTKRLDFPIRHPDIISADKLADAYSSKYIFTRSYIVRTMRKIKAFIGLKG